MIRLERQTRPLPVVSIIPLVDVLLILLVFFMVTSTFLDLDMMPMAAPENESRAATQAGDTNTILLRILPDGTMSARGQRIQPDDTEAYLASLSDAKLLILPSPQADVQSLVRVLDTAARLGLTSVDVLQLGPGP